MQVLLKVQQFLALALQHSLYRYACPFGDNLRNIIGRDLLIYKLPLRVAVAFGCQFIYLLLQLRNLAISYLCHLAIIPGSLCRCSGILQILYLLALALHIGKHLLLLLPALVQLLLFCQKVIELICKFGQFWRFALSLDCLLLYLQLLYSSVKLIYGLRHRVHLQP